MPKWSEADGSLKDKSTAFIGEWLLDNLVACRSQAQELSMQYTQHYRREIGGHGKIIESMEAWCRGITQGSPMLAHSANSL